MLELATGNPQLVNRDSLMTKLLFGCGYLGRRVAKLWQAADDTVCHDTTCIVTRSAARAAAWQSEGYQTLVADVTRPETLLELPPASTVLFAVGFDRAAGGTIHDVYADGVKNVLAALPSAVEQFIYISTTGVYGPAHGAWVDETTAAHPQRDGGKASLAAEQSLVASLAAEQSLVASLAAEQSLVKNSILLRFAGIYGPDRIPYLAKLRAGEPIAAPSEGWLNLIHVDDGAAIVLAAETWAKRQAAASSPTTPHVFCVSDGQPVRRGDYYREVARLIGAASPQFTRPDPQSPAALRANSDKRVSNAKLQQELKIEFAYPSYRAGLAAIL